MNQDVCIVSCHYNEDLSWLINQQKYAYKVYSKTNINYRYVPANYGTETEAYLHFIVDNYESLPETMVFVHGHERSFHQDGTILEILEGFGDLSKYNYISLNNIMGKVVYDVAREHEHTSERPEYKHLVHHNTNTNIKLFGARMYTDFYSVYSV